MKEENQQNLIDEATLLRQQIQEANEKVNNASLKDFAKEVSALDKIVIKMRKLLRGHMAKIYSIDWLQQEEFPYLLSASQDGYLMVWNAVTTNKVAAIPLSCSWVMACSYSPTGNYVASGGLDDVCSIFSLQTESGTPAFKKELFGHTAYISCCKWIDDQQIITSSGDKTCVLWDVEKGVSKQNFVGHHKGAMSISLQPNSKDIFCSGGCDGLLKVWDIRSGSCVQTFNEHKQDINCVQYFPTGTAIGTASEDGTSRLFDTRSDQQISIYDCNLVGNGSEFLTNLAFSKSGRLLFVAKWDHSIQVYDTLKAEPIVNIVAHENLVQSLALSPDGKALASASWDTCIKIWA